MRKYIELEEFLSKTGLEGKIYQSCINRLTARKKCIGQEEYKKKFKSDGASLRAHYAGYDATYTKKYYDYYYNREELINLISEIKTVTYYGKTKEIDTSYIIEKIKRIR